MPDPTFQWATEQDRIDAERDAWLYGNVFLKRGEDGLMRRVDPTTIVAAESAKLTDTGSGG